MIVGALKPVLSFLTDSLKGCTFLIKNAVKNYVEYYYNLKL